MTFRIRAVAQRLALAAGSVVLCLLTLEVAVRALGILPPPPNMFRFSDRKGYELVPGRGDVNSRGLRGPEYVLPKPSQTFRILAIGDSFTFGPRMAAGETYVHGLETALNTRLGGGGTRFEVQNAGVPGYNTQQEMDHLLDTGLQFEPDLILLCFTLGDAERGALGLKAGEERVWLARGKEWVKNHFALYGFVRLRFARLQDRVAAVRSGAREGGSAVVPLTQAARGNANPGWEACRESLIGISDIARERRIPCLLVIFPMIGDFDDGYPFRREHALVSETARDAGMAVLDLLPYFAGIEASALWMSPTDGHPNARGHSIAAEALYGFLLEHSLVPGARLSKETAHAPTPGASRSPGS